MPDHRIPGASTRAVGARRTTASAGASRRMHAAEVDGEGLAAEPSRQDRDCAADLPAMAALDAGASDADFVRQASRDGLDAARCIFHLVKHAAPARVLANPQGLGMLVQKAGELVESCTEGLKAGAALVEGAAAGAAGAAPDGWPRPRADDPLAPALEMWRRAAERYGVRGNERATETLAPEAETSPR